MSTEYWLNKVGAASGATSAGGRPAYGLALDTGTAPLTAEQFAMWVEDQTRRTYGAELEQTEAQARDDDVSYFLQGLGGLGAAIQSGIGLVTGGGFNMPRPDGLFSLDWSDSFTDARERGGEVLSGIGDIEIGMGPGNGVTLRELGRGYLAAWEGMTRPFETVALMDRNAQMGAPKSGFWAYYDARRWLSGDEWSRAWRQAEETTLGQAVVEAIASGRNTTQEDLERARRTNSLYGVTSFAIDLVASFKFDPSVLAAKGLGEAVAVHSGRLPSGKTRTSPTGVKHSTRTRAESDRVLHAETLDDALALRYHGFNPAGYYGNWRGRHLVKQNFAGVIEAAQTMSWREFLDLTMFKDKAAAGPQGAMMFWVAARSGDPKLIDLTRRAVYGDPRAWAEIRHLSSTASADEIAAYAPGTQSLLDAIDAMKTKYERLDEEIADLETKIQKRQARQPMYRDSDSPLSDRSIGSGFFNYHTWELDREIELKMLDQAQIDRALAGYGDDYQDWLRAASARVSLERLNARVSARKRVQQRTWVDTPYGFAHTIMSLPRAVWVREANPINLNPRGVDTGVQSIMRQFQQYEHLSRYRNPDAVNDILMRFVRAKSDTERRDIAREVELQHGMYALAQEFGLSTQLIEHFLRQGRMRVDDMLDAIVRGDNSIYSSAPHDRNTIVILDGKRKYEYKLPVDVTQLADWYTPMDYRRVRLAIKRRPDLFRELDNAIQSEWRRDAGLAMNTIDKIGTVWNSIWKPFQLFRLAWPQRVILDESFRAMATLGMTFATQQAVAGGYAVSNIPSRLLAGPATAFRRRRVKLGPGPLTDRVLGNDKYADHQAEVEDAPFVPDYFAPAHDKRRAAKVDDFVTRTAQFRAVRTRVRALQRDPNPTESLRFVPTQNLEWADIDDALTDDRRYSWDDTEPDVVALNVPLRGEEFTLNDLALARPEDLWRTPDEAVAAIIHMLGGPPNTGEAGAALERQARAVERFLDSPPYLQQEMWEGRYLGSEFWHDRELFAPATAVARRRRDESLEEWEQELVESLPDEVSLAGVDINDPDAVRARVGDTFGDNFDIVERPEGALRPIIRELIKRGRKDFEAEVARRKRGKNAGPLFGGEFRTFSTRLARRDLLLAKALGAKWAPFNTQGSIAAWFTGRRAFDIRDRDVYYADSPLFTALRRSIPLMEAGSPQIPLKPVVTLFDPTNGRADKSGYAVRVKSIDLPYFARHFDDPHFPPAVVEQIESFVGANAELLSAKNFRLLVERDGADTKISVARHFRATEQDKAAEFAAHVGQDSLYHLGRAASLTKGGNPVAGTATGAELYLRDANDLSPIMEQIRRQYVVTPEREFVAGHAPIEGGPAVYHGASDHLPLDEIGDAYMRPRDQVPVANGRMVGEGFYTTTSRETAEDGYAHGDPTLLYTIRGSRTGRTYKIFDLDQEIAPEDADDLLIYIRSYYDQVEDDQGPGYLNPEDLDFALNEIHSAGDWLGLISALDQWYVVQRGIYKQPQQLVTQWLIDNKNAGALTHVGGRRIGGFGEHQVYVWLFPEDLIVRPAYEPSGKFYLLEEWLTHPNSRERLPELTVPENRIVRKGKRIPELRELETIHNKRMALEDEVGAGVYATDEWGELIDQEITLMRRLGLDYTHNIRNQPVANHWYTQRRGKDVARNREFMDAYDAARVRNQNAETPDFGMGAVQSLGAVDTTASELLHEVLTSGWNHVHERFVRKLYQHHQFGNKKAYYRTADGQRVLVADIFSDAGINFIPLLSSTSAYRRLSDQYDRTLAMYRTKATGHKFIPVPDLTPQALGTRAGRGNAREYYGAWADLLNNQVRNSPIWHKMLQGDSDEEILRWLGTHEGRLLRERIPHRGHNPERWVEEHRERLDYYLPDPDLRRLLRDERITPAQLQRIERDEMPDIYGPDVEMVRGDVGLGAVFGKGVDRVYHALGTVPTDLLVRQPFARAMYQLKMRNLVGAARKDEITNEDLQKFEEISREFALRQVKKTLYDLADESNFTQAVRFLAPFWGAQEEAIMKWGRIVAEKPETVARFYIGQEFLYGHFQVIDEEGKPVEKGPDGMFHYNPNHRVLVQIPKNLKKVPYFAKALEAFGSTGIAIGAMNTAMQGDKPFLPGLGPIVAVPLDSWLDARKDMGVKYSDDWWHEWVFPVGRPAEGFGRVLDQSLPGWARRVQQLIQKEGNRTYGNTYYTVMREMYLDHQRKGLPPPSPQEVAEAVEHHYRLRIMASFALPFPMEWRPNNQLYLDEYHKFNQLYGPGEGFERFVRKYGPDYARYAASSSESRGVPPTIKGMAEWEKVSDLFQEHHQDWGSAMIGPDAWEDEFSSEAYDAQFEINLGPGDDTRLREPVNPAQRLTDTEIRLGWLEFRRVDALITAELYKRGLTSTEQAGAEDLAQIKAAFIQKNREDYPAWSRDFDSYENTIYDKIRTLQEWAFDPRFDNRPDILGVRQYLAIREAAAQSLDAWAAQGGSRNLQTEENDELRLWFYTQVGTLIQANPAFGEFYSRYLSQDRLTRGSGP